MNPRLLKHYMERLEDLRKLSYATREQVGAIVITPNGGTYDGVNGRFPGHPNVCEETLPAVHGGTFTRTLDEVYHAEQSALAKMLNEGVSAKGSILLCSHLPCISCSKWIARAGIIKVIYTKEYGIPNGRSFLESCNVEVIKYEEK